MTTIIMMGTNKKVKAEKKKILRVQMMVPKRTLLKPKKRT